MIGPPPATPEPSRPRRFGWLRLGFRGEILLLFPLALLLLLLVSLFTLFSYRNGLNRMAEQHRAEAASIAASAAEVLAAAADDPTADELRRSAPEALRVTLTTAEGRVVASWSDPRFGLDAVDEPLAPLGTGSVPEASELVSALGVGPGAGLDDDVVAGFAPLGPPAARRLLRCDLPGGALARQMAGLGPLTAVVLVTNGTVLLLLLLFLRHLLSPFNALLDRARRLGGGEPERDEVAFLLRTFERAVEALSSPEGEDARGPEADIAALSRTLSASLESGVLLLDAGGEVLALNPVGASLLGIPEPEAGQPVAAALAEHPRLADLVTDAVAGRRGVRRAEVEIDRTATGGEAEDPGPVTLGMTAHPLRRDDGAVRGFLVLFADLTESRRRADEARLEESLAQLGELSAGIAHELRNSLATLRGYLTLIERAPGEEKVGDYLDEIRRETDHLHRVLDDFLAFARPGTVRLEPVAVAGLVRRAAGDPALDGSPIDVTVGDQAESVLVPGDPLLLERAVRNLLHNAVRAQRETDAGEAVRVEVRLHSAKVEVAVRDRGPGIPEAMRGRLFHPFSTGRADGVGLGLALTHRIATLHGGTARVEDRPRGGCVAILEFPVDGAAAAVEA